MIDATLDFFFPPICPFCRELLTSREPVCKNCMDILPFLPENCCRICSRPIEDLSYHTCADCRNEKIYFEHSFIPLLYKGVARDTAILLKSGHPYFSKGFAYLMADSILSSPYYTDFDLITFVPQSKKGKYNRGYNQSEHIANDISKLLNIPCEGMLIRTNDGEDQHTLSAAQRKKNVRKCYFPKRKEGRGTVLLVDDIYTTGATVNYCSYLLRKMGFEKVYITTALIRADD